MAAKPLDLPVIQNWSCHSCAGCCRQHAIEITEEERQRIVDQHWERDDAIGPDQPVIESHGGPPWNRTYRLAHQADGACVFLNDEGLCRIHAKFGEDAKPLACRVYPYAFHPAGKKVAVSLRFSCPSAVGNRGAPVADQKQEIRRIARAVVPDGVAQSPPPLISPGSRVDWPDVMQFVDALDATFADGDAPFVVKLLRALFWIRLVEQSQFDAITGDRLAEFLELVTQAAAAEVSEVPQMEEPTKVGRVQFRLLAAQYGRRDTFAVADSGFGRRWELFKSGLAFARGTGDAPPLQAAFRPVAFERLEEPFGGIPAEAEEILTRYFRVKIQGLHFLGAAYYGVPLVEGFRSLALIAPSMLYLARWLAAGDGRSELQVADVGDAVSIADHHHGFSPAFGKRAFRRRVKLLESLGDVERLIAWYSR